MLRPSWLVQSKVGRLVLPLIGLLALSLLAAPGTFAQSALEPAGPVAQMQHDLFMLVFWLALGIFVVVVGVLLYVVVKYRRKPGQGIPKQTQGNHQLEIAWTIVPILITVAIAVPTVRGAFWMAEVPEGDSVRVHVTAHQWWWEFEYPEYGIVTANQLHIPTDKVIHLTMESADVIHSFWVPNLAGKLDTNPGKVNEMWFQADEPGIYYGQCAEFCGIAHANMRFRVVASEPDTFDTWVEGWSQEHAAEVPTAAEVGQVDRVARGKEVFTQRACIACHAIAGTNAQGRVGPDLTYFGDRTMLGAGLVPNTPENLAAWIRDPQAIKPGNFMPALGLSDEELDAVVAYLHSLKQ